MSMTVAALSETAAGERRVAITPEMAKKWRARGVRILLQHDAGRAAGFPDAAYADVEFADAAAVSRAAARSVGLRLRPAANRPPTVEPSVSSC